MRATEADPAVDGSRVRAERRPPPLPHPQSPARGQVSVHSVWTTGRTDQLSHRVRVYSVYVIIRYDTIRYEMPF